MRFQIREYKEIQSRISTLGLDIDKFTFVKKRGWVNISTPDRETVFRFFRDKQTAIDENGQWQDTISYKSQTSKKEIVEHSSAEEMYQHFASWLKPQERS